MHLSQQVSSPEMTRYGLNESIYLSSGLLFSVLFSVVNTVIGMGINHGGGGGDTFPRIWIGDTNTIVHSEVYQHILCIYY